MSTEHLIEWLFDGAGGAAVLALMGFAYHKFRFGRDTQSTQSIVSESVDVAADDKSIAVGSRSSVQTSPVVYGSHNTISISHHVQNAKAGEAKEPGPEDDEKKGEESSWVGALAALIGVSTMFCFVGGFIWVLSNPETVRGVLEGNPAASTIAFQYGTGIAVADATLGEQVTSCADASVVCLGEDLVPRTAIPIPELPNGNWSRIAVFVTYTKDGDSSRVLVSTSSNDVKLDYAGHRDGNVNRKIEFQMPDIKAISETQKSYWFPVDIMYQDPKVRFPITVTVNEDRRHSHSATATFGIVRLPSAAPQRRGASELTTGANPKRITIAERVTAITSQLAPVKEIEPGSDFEVDLGMSPSEVSLLIGELEEEYGITIPKDDALKIRTVDEAIHYIEHRVGHR